jgi:hypothetical protein
MAAKQRVIRVYLCLHKLDKNQPFVVRIARLRTDANGLVVVVLFLSFPLLTHSLSHTASMDMSH